MSHLNLFVSLTACPVHHNQWILQTDYTA